MCRNTNIGIFMGRKANSLLPEVISNLKTMGEQIKQARLRRNLSCEVIAQRADISRSTLCEVEKGSPSVAIGTYAAVLITAGLLIASNPAKFDMGIITGFIVYVSL